MLKTLPVISERLILRRFTMEDFEDVFEYLSDAEVLKYEPYDAMTREDCLETLKNRVRNESFLAVELKETGIVIGNMYVSKINPEHVDTYEIGYVMNKAYHHKGYATEAVRSILNQLFEDMETHRVIANANVENKPSWKLLERVGMRREATRIKNMFFEKDTEDNPMWFDSCQYAILREEWIG